MEINEVVNGKLKGKMVEKGFTIRSLSEQTSIPVSTLSNKLSGKTEFTASEMMIISKALNESNIQNLFF